MENGWWIYIVLIVVLFFLSSFFSSAETAVTSLNVIRIKSIAKLRNNKKSSKAKLVFKLVKNYNITLTTILIGNTLVNLAIGTISTIIFVDSFKLGSIAPLVSTLTSAFFVLIIGEIIPKSLAKIYPEQVALNYAYILYFFNIIFYPLTFVLKLFEIKSKKPTSSEQELIELINIIEREGVLEKGEKDLIESAIKFDEKSVFQAMQPKHRIKFIFDNTSAKLIKEIYLKEKYSRIPVLNNMTGQVIGILNIKDYISEMLQNNNQTPELKLLISEPLYISKRTKLNYALELLQAERTHIAIVCNNKEKKDFSGIITLEDILEELVGEIYDESDKIGLIQEVGTHKFLVDGSANLEVLFKKYLKTKVPVIKTNNVMNVLEWYKMKTKEKKVKKSSPEFKFRNYNFKVDKVKKKNHIIFRVEILTNKKVKNAWE